MRNYIKLLFVLSPVAIIIANLIYLIPSMGNESFQKRYIELLIIALTIVYVVLIVKSNPIIVKLDDPANSEILINPKMWLEKGLIPPCDEIKYWRPNDYDNNIAAKILNVRSNNITFALMVLNSQLGKIMPFRHNQWQGSKASTTSLVQIDHGVGTTRIIYYKKYRFIKLTLLRVDIVCWTDENFPTFGFSGPFAKEAHKVWKKFLSDVKTPS